MTISANTNMSMNSINNFERNQILDRFAIEAIRDTRELTSQSLERLLSSMREVVAQVPESARPALMVGLGQNIDTYA